MNFKTQSLIVLMTISMFLLSSCEVYQTLYGVDTKAPSKVGRIEGEMAKDPINLAKTVYAAATPIEHDPFKVSKNPLGPFEKGKSLGFTLGQWLAASGIGVYGVDGGNAELDLSFKNLVPNGVYTVWCSRITFPPNFDVVDTPCGAEDGSENSFKSDEKGNGAFSLKLKPLEASTKETVSAIALAYHSDGKTYGTSPGDFGLNSHVQIFFLLPVPSSNATKFEVPIKFVNHIDAGLPEQDVFIEIEEVMEETAPTGEVTEDVEGATEEAEGVTEEEILEDEVMEEAVEEEPKGTPFVIVVQETDLVNLVPKAEDPDADKLLFTFTSPLNELGEWQTTYGDAGEYTVTLTVSDGQSTNSRDVLIIVNKKEETPTIDNSWPIESSLVIDEIESIDFRAEASDLNKDPLAYSWKFDGVEVGSEAEYTYQSDYDSAGAHTVKVDVSDGLSSASRIWSVEALNVNRKPVMEQIGNLKSKETEEVTITLAATDDDGDALEYSISDPRFAQDENVFAWQTGYDSAGEYEITVSVSDGTDTTEETLVLTVENVNRAPVIVDVVQKS